MRSLSIQLPDLVFEEAVREAAASGLSIEEFVASMVRQGLQGSDESASLTPDQIEKVKRAQAEIQAGDSLTAEQVEAHFAQKRISWAESGRS